jgi:hypothetical protein
MLVWGGFVNSERPRYFNDGAAYDPGTNGWRMLPESPLSPRRDPASAWTGGELFVWGGADSTGTGTADDGAAYNPTTNSWRRLPKAPIAGRLDAQTFAVDGKVIVFGGHPAVTTASDRVMLDGAVYDSDADRWRPLPPAPRTDGHDVDAIVAAPAGGRLYAVLQWHRTTRNADGSGSTVGGYDAASLDLARGAWSRSDPPPTAAGLTALLPAADQLLLPAAPYVMFGAHGPPQMDLHGLARDPSGTWRQLTHGPADDLRGQSVWTGAALLTFNTGTYTSSGNSFSLPGNAAAWDPEADRWEPLPNAGWYADEPAAVWTGDTLLMWGSMYRVNGSSNPTPGPPIAHGLSYSAAGSGKIKVIGHFAAGATGSVVSGQRVTVLDGLGRSFPMFGGGELVATASTDEDGNFTLLLPAGEYTVGAYTVSFARSRIPCVTRNLVVHAEGPTPTLALSCERANASTSPS